MMPAALCKLGVMSASPTRSLWSQASKSTVRTILRWYLHSSCCHPWGILQLMWSCYRGQCASTVDSDADNPWNTGIHPTWSLTTKQPEPWT